MYRYALKKILLIIPTLLIVSLFAFTLIRMIPGDPAVMFVGDLQDAAAVQKVRRQMGLDQPVYIQYYRWVRQVAGGNLGVSLMTREPVFNALAERFSVTVQVIAPAFILAAIIAVPAGMVAAWRQNSRLDNAIVLVMIVCLSVPSFWLALLLILIFGVELNWLPSIGFVSVTEDLGAAIRYLVLPVIVLTLIEMAMLTRVMRASTIEVLNQDYITHARAKGLSESTILRRHVFKNAFAPTLTMLGLALGSLLSGTAIIETVFAIPGLGLYLVDAVYARDYPVIQGTLLFVVAVYTAVNLLADLLYPVFDPRVKLQ